MLMTTTKRWLLAAVFASVATTPVMANTMAKKMAMAKHASPMPNLMGLTLMNASALKLTPEQTQNAKAWRKENRQAVEKLIRTIHQAEKNIHQMALDGADDDTIKRLKQQILDARSALITIKHRCIKRLKADLTADQWHTLIQIKEEKARFMQVAKGESNEIQAFLRASPMPKLMYIIIAHSKELDLTDKQTKALEDWRGEHMLHWSALFDQVIQTERQITLQALAMTDAEALMQQFDAVAKKRREMAQMSLNCRNNMKKVLGEAQWQKVLTRFNDYL